MTILIGAQGFRGHINGRSDIILFGSMKSFLLDGESKITYFSGRVSEEDVGRLKISMDDSEGVEAFITFNDLMEDMEGFGFC